MPVEKDESQDRVAEIVTLVGGLAHEIKNPLSTINITLQLLRESWSSERGPLATRSVQKVDILLAECKRLEQLLADFLRLATPQELELVDHDLNAIIDQVIDFIRPEMRQQHVEVVMQLDRAIGPIRLDVNLMKQALLNLLKNSAQAMARSSQKNITIMTHVEGDEVLLDVIDTGCGMTNETIAEAFKIFYSTKPDGTGLGLPMVKRIAEHHGGRIECVSEPGVGTKFTLRLPQTK